jgi:hypothetical protein
MAQRKTLSQAQVDLLRWIGDGCPADREVGEFFRISAGALRNRGLITTDGRRANWSASITPAGTEYLAQVEGPNPPVPRQASVSLTQQLVDEVVASGGSLRVPRRHYWSGKETVDYAHRARLAQIHGKVPTGQYPRATSVSKDELLLELVLEKRAGDRPALLEVAVRERVARLHAVARQFRDDKSRHRSHASSCRARSGSCTRSPASATDAAGRSRSRLNRRTATATLTGPRRRTGTFGSGSGSASSSSASKRKVSPRAAATRASGTTSITTQAPTTQAQAGNSRSRSTRSTTPTAGASRASPTAHPGSSRPGSGISSSSCKSECWRPTAPTRNDGSRPRKPRSRRDWRPRQGAGMAYPHRPSPGTATPDSARSGPDSADQGMGASNRGQRVLRRGRRCPWRAGGGGRLGELVPRPRRQARPAPGTAQRSGRAGADR